MSAVGGWYPLALSTGVDPGMSSGTTVDGREFVVWRDTEGAAHLWEDRCPHRGMRFSFGFVRGNHIACLYHGWQFDTAGQCRHIPAHPQLTPPETIRANLYPLVERAGMIWGHTVAGTPVFDRIAERTVTPLRSLHVDCAPDTVAAVLAMTNLPPFRAGGGALRHTATVDGPLAVLSVEGGVARDEVIVGIQPLTSATTALHMVIAGEPAHYRGAGQVHFAYWAEELRRALENSEAPIDRIVEAAE